MSFQIGATLLDACVLGVLSREDAYGYSLTQSLQDVITISDSTTYPVLRRLQKEGCLVTYDQPFQGRNRRYYAITDQGREKHEQYVKQWDRYKVKIDKVLKGGDQSE